MSLSIHLPRRSGYLQLKLIELSRELRATPGARGLFVSPDCGPAWALWVEMHRDSNDPCHHENRISSFRNGAVLRFVDRP